MKMIRASTQVWYRLPSSLRDQVREVAAHYGESQSMVVVRALTLYLETQLGLIVEQEERLP